MMKAKIDASGNLFIDKGNGFMPQVCVKDFSLQCCMACPHFGEPRVDVKRNVNNWLTKHIGGEFAISYNELVVYITICNQTELVFETLHFEGSNKIIGKGNRPK